jgi:PEP-CTERM motif
MTRDREVLTPCHPAGMKGPGAGVAGILAAAILFVGLELPARAGSGVIEYGNENVLGTGTYSSDPKAGATLTGLAPGVVTMANLITPHGYPFSPGPGDFQGTDQIYVGTNQTAIDDGYSAYSGRIQAPDVLTMDYSGLVPAGQSLTGLTLGIAADDFQFPVFGNPFTATVNGTVDVALTNELNSLNETGPVVQFFTIGLGLSELTNTNVLTLSISEGGTGGDGYAIDFLTIGVTTQSVPEPSSLILFGAGTLAILARGMRRRAGTERRM